MSPLTALLRRAMDLPAPRTSRITVARAVAVPMPDGVVLRHDHHRPRGAVRGPVVLVRSPYGRAGIVGTVFGGLVAERGLQVVVQSVRGTSGSGGELSPFDEADDGVATARWVLAQPWCDGRLATFGPSYLGITQWALAADTGPALQAMGLLVTASQFRDQTYPGGAFSLDNALSWAALMHDRARGGVGGLWRRSGLDPRLRRAMGTLPLRDADRVATGEHVGFWHDWLREEAPDSAYWAERSYGGRVGEVARAGTAVSSTAGWQDIFLPWQLDDYVALREAGARPRLVIGPWVHASPVGTANGLREAMALFDRRLGLEPDPDRLGGEGVRRHGRTGATTEDAPVSVELSGGGGHRSLADWPPPAGTTRARAWFLRTDHSLAEAPPDAGVGEPEVRWAGTLVRYDPSDPTPAVGGPILTGRSGPRDQTALESRADVAVFTGPVLADDLVVLGPARAVVHLRAESEHLDVFVRVCDVDDAGRSVNVTDGLRRLRPGDPGRSADGSVEVAVDLWPVGHRFVVGHRVRVQVSGGAHPRFARHPGTAAALGDASVLVPRDREVLHDRAHPTRVEMGVEIPAGVEVPVSARTGAPARTGGHARHRA